jgi:hypothetical protein
MWDPRRLATVGPTSRNATRWRNAYDEAYRAAEAELDPEADSGGG